MFVPMSINETMRKFFIIGLILGTFSLPVTAQRKLKDMDSDKESQKDRFRDDENGSWKDKISFGGNLTGGIGNGSAFFLIQPQVFYRVLPKSMVGAGITYIYWSQKYIDYTTNQAITLSDNAYGLNLFARQTLFGPIFAHVEYMPINFTAYNRYGDQKRVWGNSLYLGGGYSNATNQKSGVYILLLYDVLWQQDDLSDPKTYTKTFYASPWNFRIGFMF
jgi:hypothetical protein